MICAAPATPAHGRPAKAARPACRVLCAPFGRRKGEKDLPNGRRGRSFPGPRGGGATASGVTNRRAGATDARPWSNRITKGPEDPKKATPEITLQQVRAWIASTLHEALGRRPAWEIERRLQRKALARFYHWEKRNLLAPLREAG